MEDKRAINHEEALNIIRKNLREGSLRITKHAKEELRNAKCDIQDVIHIIRNPTSIEDLEYDAAHNNWKAKIKGIALDGYELTIVIAFWEDEIRLVTAW